MCGNKFFVKHQARHEKHLGKVANDVTSRFISLGKNVEDER